METQGCPLSSMVSPIMTNLYREEMQGRNANHGIDLYLRNYPSRCLIYVNVGKRQKKPKPDHINELASMRPARDEGKEEKTSEKVWLSWFDSQREETTK